MKKTTQHQEGIFYTRAIVDPETVIETEEEKTFEVVFATETPVFRRGWEENFSEVLSIDLSHIRTERLEAGAVPLLDNHDSETGIEKQYGTVISYRLQLGEARAKIRWSTRTDLEKYWKDIKAGVIKSISTGYRVFKYLREVVSDNSLPIYKAVDWEPMEISLAPVPADFRSQVRTGTLLPHTITIEDFTLTKNAQKNMHENPEVVDTAKPNNQTSEKGDHITTKTIDETKIRKEAIQSERQRIDDIYTAVRAAGLTDNFAASLIESGSDINSARAEIINKLAESTNTSNIKPKTSSAIITVDEKDNLRNALQTVILHRADPSNNKLEGKAQDFKGMKLLDMARYMLDQNGESSYRFSQNELIHRAIATTDYPDLLTSTVSRQLRRFFEAADSQWQRLGHKTTVNDFRAKTGIQVDGAVSFEKVSEGGEYKSSKILQNSKATISVDTYGRIISISRQAIINDDLDIFSKIPKMIAQGAKNLQAKMFWELVSGNAKTPDGKTLFHADHNNLAAAGSALNETSLNAALVAMLKQQSPAGEELNIAPKFLIVPVELQTTAKKLISSIVATKTGDVNPFQNEFEIISEVRLSRQSSTAWYMAADPSTIEGLEYAYLDGEEGLHTESRVNFDNDTVETKARMEFGVSCWDHRGWFKNAGA